MAAFAAATRRLAGGNAEVSVISRADLTRLVEEGTRVQAVALVLFAALAAVAALVVVGQSLARELSLASTGQETVRALGASRGLAAGGRDAADRLVGCAGAVAGAGIAVLASPSCPMGLALRVEPDPGFSVHLAGVALGMVATLVLVAGRVAVPAWRLAGQRPHRPDATGPAGAGSTLADRAARPACRPARWPGCAWRWSRGGPAGGAGAHLAGRDHRRDRRLHRRGHLRRQSGPAARHPSTVRLELRRRRRDWQLDDPATRRPSWLAANPHVGAYSAVCSPRSGSTAPWSARPARHAGGRVFPTLVEGREPSGPDEVVLGAATLRRLGLRLGQTVRVEAGRPAAMRVVGRSALVNIDSENAGDGAILTIEGLRRLEPARGSGYGVFYVRYAPGPIPRRRSRACGGRRPGRSRRSASLGRRPTSRTWGGSAIYRTCSPGCSPCWPPPPSPTCW